MTSSGLAAPLSVSMRYSFGARRRTFSTPGSTPVWRKPRSTQRLHDLPDVQQLLRAPRLRCARCARSPARARTSPARCSRHSAQQLLARLNGIRRRLRARAPRAASLSSPRTMKPPPIGVVVLLAQHAVARVKRGEAHAVRVPRQPLVVHEQQLHRLIESDLVLAQQTDASGRSGCAAPSARCCRDRRSPAPRPRAPRAPRGRCRARHR